MGANQIVINFFLSKYRLNQNINNDKASDHLDLKISRTFLFNHSLISIWLS